MAQSSEIKLLKRFDQDVEITGNLTVGGVPVSPSSYLTSIPSEYLTQTEGDARYLQTLPSHNHDGSYLKRLGDVTVTNFDTLPEGVLGSDETTATNQPYANHHITLTLYNDASAGRRAQLFLADSAEGGLWYRPRQGDTIGWHPWQEIVTSNNIGNYALTSLPSHTHDYVFEGGTDFNGEYPMVVRTGADTIYSNAGIKYRGSDDRLNVGGYIYTPRIDISNSTNGGNFNGSNDWGVRFNTNDGYIQLGPANTGHAHIYTDRPDFYFNRELYVNGEIVWHSGNSDFVKQLDNASSPDYLTPSSRRVEPNVSNPTNAHHAISTFGNGGNVTGQLAIHFTTGAPYTRAYNTSWTSWRKIWTDANDGAGSGLHADLLDGQHGSYYAQASLSNNKAYTSGGNEVGSFLGGHYSSGGTEKPNSATFGSGKLKIAMLSSSNLGFGGSWNDVLWMSTYSGGDVKRSTAIVSSKYDNTSLWLVKQNFDASDWGTGYLFWNSGNDGAGSGLDADLLDGLQGSQYLRSDTSDTFGGNLTVNGTLNVSGYADFQGDAAIGGGSGYGYFKGYTSNWNHLMTCRGIVSGSTSSPSISGGHQQTFVEYVNTDDAGWFFKSSDSGTYYEKVSFRRTYNIFQEDVRAPLFYDEGNTSYYLDPASTSRIRAIGDESGGALHVMYPNGASYGSNSTTGAFKITLPQSWTNTMMRMHVEIFNYSSNSSIDVYISGYNYAGNGGLWVNTSAYIVAPYYADANYTVRFGHDGSNCCVYIGETNTSWSYPKVVVKSFQAGHSAYELYRWDDNWTIQPVTSLASNIDATFTDLQVGRYIDRLYDRDNNSYSLKPSSQSSLSTLAVGSTTVGDGVFSVRNGDMLIDRGREIRWNTGTGSGEYIYSKTSSPYDVTIHSGAHDALQCPNTGQVRINYQGSQKFVTTSSGVSITGSMTASGDVIAYSDERIKENVKTIDNALDKVTKLRGVEYNKIGEEKQNIGVIAQEVEKILPQVVTEDEEGMKGVAYGNIVGVLIEAIKEQQKQIDELKSLINKS